MNDKGLFVFLALAKYSNALVKTEINNTETLKKFNAMMRGFLSRFDWTASYIATYISTQEKRGDKRFIGVCYDACKYLAQKLTDEGIEYKSYWLCDCEIKSILSTFYNAGSGIKNQKIELEKAFRNINAKKEEIAPLVYESLHSFNLCNIEGNYYFADNFYAPILSNDKQYRCFSNEKDGIAWAGEALFHKKPYLLREFDPLAAEMGNHILYTLRRLYNLTN